MKSEQDAGKRGDHFTKTTATCDCGGEGDDRGCNGWMASPTRWA